MTREEQLKQAIEEACHYPDRLMFKTAASVVLSTHSVFIHADPKIMGDAGWFNKSELQVKTKDNYFPVHCECGWIGSSEQLLGGGQIADTGDYGDCYCPACGKVDPCEADELTVDDYKNAIESMTKIIIGLRDTIEKNYYEKQAGWVKEQKRPKVICYCGSIRVAKEAFQKAEYDCLMRGEISLLPCCMFVDIEREYGAGSEYKQKADEQHKRQIDMCDEVFVLNVGGYIGQSTRSEIEYATSIGKPIKYLENIILTT